MKQKRLGATISILSLAKSTQMRPPLCSLPAFLGQKRLGATVSILSLAKRMQRWLPLLLSLARNAWDDTFTVRKACGGGSAHVTILCTLPLSLPDEECREIYDQGFALLRDSLAEVGTCENMAKQLRKTNAVELKELLLSDGILESDGDGVRFVRKRWEETWGSYCLCWYNKDQPDSPCPQSDAVQTADADDDDIVGNPALKMPSSPPPDSAVADTSDNAKRKALSHMSAARSFPTHLANQLGTHSIVKQTETYATDTACSGAY
eukprot:s4793_g8.t1